MKIPINPPLGIAKPLVRTVTISVAAYTAQHNVRIPYVTGDTSGISRPSDLLAAASENVRLAPHWWHRVAVMPTSDPQAGQIFGRGAAFCPLKIPLSFF
ncbi:MAG: hypothetical protein ACRD5K_09670 [Candidatus Acidiferrales bacterium]